MPPKRTNKKRVHDAERSGHETEQSLFVTPEPPRKPNKGRQSHEYEKDEGRSASQHFLQQVKDAKNKKKAVEKQAFDFKKTFKDDLQKQSAQLLELIGTSLSEHAVHNVEFLDTFRKAYNMSMLNSDIEMDADRIDLAKDVYTAGVRDECANSISQAYRLMEDIAACEAMIQKSNDVIDTDTLEEDLDALQATLEAGRKEGEQHIEYLIRGTTYNQNDEAKKVFYKQRGGNGSTYADIARHELHIAKKMAQLVETETDYEDD